MAALISTAQKNLVESVINAMGDTFAQDELIYRTFGGLDRFQEDAIGSQRNDRILKGLFSYNYFRQWSIDVQTISGLVDKGTQAVIFTMKYLTDENLVTPEGNFKFKNKGQDQIIHAGYIYNIVGNTILSQLIDKPLLCMLILQRDEIETGFNEGR